MFKTDSTVLINIEQECSKRTYESPAETGRDKVTDGQTDQETDGGEVTDPIYQPAYASDSKGNRYQKGIETNFVILFILCYVVVVGFHCVQSKLRVLRKLSITVNTNAI